MTRRASSSRLYPLGCDDIAAMPAGDLMARGRGGGRGLHSFTLELNLSNSRTHS